MIKHSWIIKRGEVRYVCNQAVNVIKEKLADKPEDVTCKNCLRGLSQYVLGTVVEG